MPKLRKIRRCANCDALLDNVSTARVVERDRTDNHYIEVCVGCARVLSARATHREIMKPEIPDPRQ